MRQLRPDVAILDIRMPGGNGLGVLEAVKQGDAPPVVVMLTAFAYSQYRSRCLAAKADYFFDKATEFDQVVQVLEQLLCARAANRDAELGTQSWKGKGGQRMAIS